MVRVKAPLMSLDASGTVGRSIVFSNWKGINYVRRHAIPSNPKLAAQVAIRSMFRFLTKHWVDVSGVNQATWADLTAGAQKSDFNSYVAYNQTRFRDGLGITDEYPYDGTGTAPGAPTTTPSGGVRQVVLSIADGSNPGMAWMIHKGTTGFTPAWSNVVAVVARVSSPTLWTDTPLDPGTYYYRVRGVQSQANLGALEVERSGTAT